MTVRELIAQLQKYNKDTKVMLDIDKDWDNYSREIEDIYEDFLIDINGRSHTDKCIYLETEI